eukprot:TRINITY_DN692_c0_g1_i6.p1 TRINITY_DN692_c0_g1~~TRINITY_DN692_c0_g1_i6.p1  ORF type:complete len:490 (-),score=93.55 TRINITY_DN692_c0_g1_i6:134-1603(-)
MALPLRLLLGASLMATAFATCFQVGHDVGGGANTCGYATEVKVFGEPGYDFGAHSWIASKGISTQAVPKLENLDSADDCMMLCAEAGADYFSFKMHDVCVCKKGYAESTCTPLYQIDLTRTSGPTSCALECFHSEHDVGGSANSCGYAKEVKIFAQPGYSFSAHSWIASKNIPTEHAATATELDTASDCQMLCLKSEADVFAFELGRLCVCKSGYEKSMCMPLYQAKANTTAGPTVCSPCFKNKDVGGSFSGCGYQTEVKIFGGPNVNFSSHSWIASKGISTEKTSTPEELDTASECQMLCLKSGADFFAFELGDLCVCKKAYTNTACLPLYKPTSDDATKISGPTKCDSCLMMDSDTAGGANACGYGKEVKVFGGSGYDFSKSSWIAAKGIETEEVAGLSTAEHCRHFCATTKAGLFVFAPKSQGIGRCICKEAYAHPMCFPVYQDSMDDVSGPVLCEGSTCGKLKEYYREQKCCGMPDKKVKLMSQR